MNRRLLHTGPPLGTLAHHGFELSAGVGLVFQPYLGLPGSLALWGTALPAWVVFAVGPERLLLRDPLLAALAGTSLAGALIHFVLWPVGRRRGLPVLLEAEGLPAGAMPAYNAILYGWALSALAALVLGTPRGSRRWALLGLATGLPLRASARHHFEWLAEAARRQPAWWNRAAVPAER